MNAQTTIRRAGLEAIAQLPDAAEYALSLRPGPRIALRRATFDHGATGWRAASAEDAATLRPFGLCEYPARGQLGRYLTNFGVNVRSFLVDAGAAL